MGLQTSKRTDSVFCLLATLNLRLGRGLYTTVRELGSQLSECAASLATYFVYDFLNQLFHL